MDAYLASQIRSSPATRWDLWAFVVAFFVGLGYYAAFRSILPALGWSPSGVQIALTVGILLVMLAYAIAVASVPRLRLRLDQAGDNAYYLGLLFTLTSMAFALWEFGQAAGAAPGDAARWLGTQQIISNFGIALASTIAGISIRIVLHQMRVDPTDVEGMTRIELAEASKRVRATLDNISLDMGQFHDELRQRSSDAILTLLQDLSTSGQKIAQETKSSTEAMFSSIQAAQTAVLEQTANLTGRLTTVADEAVAASERLKEIEPPPTTFARRLGQMSVKLEDASQSVGSLANDITAITTSAGSAAETMVRVADGMQATVSRIERSAVANEERISTVTETVARALGDIGNRLEADAKLFSELESQLRRSAEQGAKVQAVTVDVLKSLAEATRRLTDVVRTGDPSAPNSSTQ